MLITITAWLELCRTVSFVIEETAVLLSPPSETKKNSITTRNPWSKSRILHVYHTYAAYVAQRSIRGAFLRNEIKRIVRSRVTCKLVLSFRMTPYVIIKSWFSATGSAFIIFVCLIVTRRFRYVFVFVLAKMNSSKSSRSSSRIPAPPKNCTKPWWTSYSRAWAMTWTT